jgi:hypothetical protein
MNCCDDYGDCNQGRDCPVRKVRAYPHVPDDMMVEYVPTWRDRLVDLARAMLYVMAAIGVVTVGAVIAGVLR